MKAWVSAWFQRLVWRLALTREQRLELHILNFASDAESWGGGVCPSLKGYSQAEIDAKVREMAASGLLRWEIL